MNNKTIFAALLSLTLFARLAAAQQENAPAAKSDVPEAEQPAETPAAKPKPAPKAAEPKAEEAKPEAPVESKPEPKAAPKIEPKAAEAEPEAPKPEPKPQPKPMKKAEEPKVVEAPKPTPAPAPIKELTPCAKIFVPLADSYKKAYEDWQKWIESVDAQTSAATAKIDKLQEQIEKNEAAITKLKLAGGSENSAKGRDLGKDNKMLWTELSATRRERSALCAGFAKEAVQKARQFQSEMSDKLDAVKAQTK